MNPIDNEELNLLDEPEVEESFEEDLEEGLEEEVVEEPEQDEGDNEVVARAKKYGHLSKEEWEAMGRDPDQWKSPEEFDKTGKILDQVYSMRKKLDERDKQIQALVEYNQRVIARDREKLRQEYEDKLAASKDDMDVEGVAHYTRELARFDDQEKIAQAQQLNQQVADAEQRFAERNKHWYNDLNPDLVAKAHEVSAQLRQYYPEATPDELAQKIETRMQYDFPDRTTTQASSRPVVPQSRSSVNKTAKSSTTRTFASLSPEHKEVFKTFKECFDQNYTEKDFIEQLKRDGEI